MRYTHHTLKRGFDIVTSLTVLVLLSPFILGALIAIKAEQILRGRPGDPLFYGEIRMSRGKPFTLYKFNIFKYEQVEELRAKKILVHTKQLEHHGGILRVGWVLKQIYMDELPQLCNVLLGEMSLVGPRPVNLEVYADLTARGVHDKDRVPAGMTGWFQCHKSYEPIDMVEADRYYADYYEREPGYKVLWFDLCIIWRTLKVVLRARGI